MGWWDSKQNLSQIFWKKRTAETKVKNPQFAENVEHNVRAIKMNEYIYTHQWPSYQMHVKDDDVDDVDPEIADCAIKCVIRIYIY